MDGKLKVIWPFTEFSTGVEKTSPDGMFRLPSEFIQPLFFVEKEKDATIILKKNIKKLKLENKTKIFAENVFQYLKKEISSPLKFNLIFCDPPFKDSNVKELFDLLLNSKILKKDGIIVLHRNKSIKNELPDYLKIIDERIYGISRIIFGKF